MFTVYDPRNGSTIGLYPTWHQAMAVATWMAREFLALFIVREVRAR